MSETQPPIKVHHHNDYRISFYAGRDQTARHLKERNWVDDPALKLGPAMYAINSGKEAIVYDTFTSGRVGAEGLGQAFRNRTARCTSKISRSSTTIGRTRHCLRLHPSCERPNQAGWPLLSSSASGSSSKGSSSSRRSGASSGFGMEKPGGKFESKRPAPLSSVSPSRSWI